ncbi:YybH family protein [Corallococcus exercitus]|uniref:YybH family protein n=1 Tax=Corallococcus exercitus TaxID=2316736 RepID=UPI0035D432B9
MKRMFAGALVVAALGTLGCGGAKASGPGAEAGAGTARRSVEDLRAGLRAADQSLSDAAEKSGSAQAFADFVADDAVLLVDGAYAQKGREAIRAWLAAHPLEAEGKVRWTPVRWDVSADGTLGYSVGNTSVESGGTSVRPSGRYITAWKRQPDGQWRVVAAVHNASKTAMTPPAGFTPSSTLPAPAPRAMAPEQVLEEAKAADRAFAAQSASEGMGKAFTAYAAEDAVMPLGSAGLFGHDAVAKAYAPFTLDKIDLRWEPVLGDAAGSGDLAFTVGRAIATGRNEQGQPEVDHVKYLTIWRRQADGQWRYVTDGGNSSPGPQGP